MVVVEDDVAAVAGDLRLAAVDRSFAAAVAAGVAENCYDQTSLTSRQCLH